VRATIKVREPRARVAEADAVVHRDQPIGGQPVSAVPHVDLQLPAASDGADADASRPRPRRDAVTDGVLDERLQEQMGDARVEDGGIDAIAR
jgi:hypothetical protein